MAKIVDTVQQPYWQNNPDYKCPHCGALFIQRELRGSLIPTHDFPPPCRSVCLGSGQVPRNAITDFRPLWKDEQPISHKEID